MGMIYVKRMCKKCYADLKFMTIGSFRIPYCPKCTDPNKKKRGFFADLSEEKRAMYRQLGKDKKKVTQEVWKGKQEEKLTGFRPKPKNIPPRENANGTPNDAYIRYRRKVVG
jgi:NMD protein affecting ribosome stability and mRNA decay